MPPFSLRWDFRGRQPFRFSILRWCYKPDNTCIGCANRCALYGQYPFRGMAQVGHTVYDHITDIGIVVPNPCGNSEIERIPGKLSQLSHTDAQSCSNNIIVCPGIVNL